MAIFSGFRGFLESKRVELSLKGKYIAYELVPGNGVCQEISLRAAPSPRRIGICCGDRLRRGN